MRLIDADKLKEAMMKAFDCENATKYGNKNAEQQAHSYSTLMLYEISDIVEDLIDNAPTVDTTCPHCDSGYAQGYSDGYLKGIEERPQGKWKITEAYPHKVYCGKCYKTYAQENWEVWKDGSLPRNFCPNCGADMRKGGAE